MRFMITHNTEARWEAGEIPAPELIERVGKMIGALAQAGVLLAAEGLRATSRGVRLRFSGTECTVTRGPFTGSNELLAAFAILKVGSIEEAIEWAKRYSQVARAAEIDIRPVTEPWDIGLGAKPKGLATRRFMLLHKADKNSENGVPMEPAQRAAMAKLIAEMTGAGVLMSLERLQPTAQGMRLKSRGGKSIVTDGPFTETKEVIAGFVIVRAESIEEVREWLLRYTEAVGAEETAALALCE
jgi:hypothetical protein